MTPSRPPALPALRRALVTGLVAGLLSGALAPASPAAATDPSYVALGDSYSSGVGTREYVADGTSCKRSGRAFPSLLASARGWRLTFPACAGATVAHVRRAQLSALRSRTGFVTVSVGGNDAGFAGVLTECATPWWAGDCRAAVDRARSFIRATLPGRLRHLYAAIRDRAPRARVVAVGYPRLFMGEDCNAGTWFSATEQRWLNDTADLLDAVTGAAARDRGLGFADPRARFVGHAVCDDREWVNGLSRPVGESYHPNRAGHASGYVPVVGTRLTGTAARVGTADRRTAVASAPDSVARAPEQSAADTALLRPPAFRAPDLTTPQAARAARAHGIDIDRWLRRHQPAAPPSPHSGAGHVGPGW